MKNRVITAIILIAIFVPAFLIGGIITNLMVAAIVGLVVHELVSLRKDKANTMIKMYLYAAFLGLCFVAEPYFMWLLYLFGFSLFAISFAIESFDLVDVMLYATLAILMSFAGRGTLIAAEMGSIYLFYIASVTYGVDTGAFFGGKFFGKHKLLERISPKKTWEGAIAGYLAGFLVAMIYYFAFHLFDLHVALTLAFVLSFTGQLGDLIFSSIKRHFHAKDFGSLLPGHGGILDRIDSLLINIVMMTLIVRMLG